MGVRRGGPGMSAGYSAGYLGAASGWTPACPLGPRYPVGRAVSHHVSQYVVHCGVPTVCRQLRVTLLPFPRQGQRAGCIRCLRERHRGQQPDAGEAVSTERAWDCRAWRTPLSRLGGGTGGQGQGEHLISGQHLIFSSFNFKQIHPDFLLSVKLLWLSRVLVTRQQQLKQARPWTRPGACGGEAGGPLHS